MSVLPETMGLDRLGIERLKVDEDVKVWLRQLVDTSEQIYQLIRDFAEAGGFATKDWQGKQVGDNLEFQKNGVKKGAITG